MNSTIKTSDRLKLLDELIHLATQRTRNNRVEQFLRQRDPADNDGWAYYLPSCYNSALDIHLTPKLQPPPCNFSWEAWPKKKRCTRSCEKKIWTQGANFSFGRGDMIYDTPAGYKDWSLAIKEIETVLQISSASAAAPKDGANPRYSGRVEFRIFRPNSDRTALDEHESAMFTQDEFVRYLIAGEL
jgi:hypothetical protein